MPLDDNLRLQILSINCATERLRKELEIVRKVINCFLSRMFSFSTKCTSYFRSPVIGLNMSRD